MFFSVNTFAEKVVRGIGGEEEKRNKEEKVHKHKNNCTNEEEFNIESSMALLKLLIKKNGTNCEEKHFCRLAFIRSFSTHDICWK